MKDNINWFGVKNPPNYKYITGNRPQTVDEYINELHNFIDRLTKEVNDVAAERDRLRIQLDDSIKTEEYTLQEWSSREMLEELLARESSEEDES